jgi:hypothetical protein
MFGGSKNNQQQNTSPRRRGAQQQLRPHQDEALAISGPCATICAMLIVGAGALFSTIFFSIYPPYCASHIATLSARYDNNHKLIHKELTPPKEVVAQVASISAAAAAAASAETGSKFPPECTSEQMDLLKKQLPPGGCVANANQAYKRMDCSFSAATNCGFDPIWLYEFHAQNDVIEHDPSAEQFQGIWVGCNNAYDVIEMLQIVSRHQDRYDWEAWKTEFIETDDNKKKVEEKRPSDCPNRTVITTNPNHDKLSPQKVQAYCIEGSPTTYGQLEKVKRSFGYADDELDLSNVVIALGPGMTPVYTGGPISEYTTGTAHWHQKCHKFPDECISVKTDKIDNWIKTKPDLADPKGPIHYMSVTVEGNEYEVLQGSARNLARVQYLDLNYNWFGDWGKNQRSLKDLMFRLKKKGFVCYWPGDQGNMWRITGCYQDHYELRFFANIACVNTNITAALPLAEKMERMFLDTLNKPFLHFGKD